VLDHVVVGLVQFASEGLLALELDFSVSGLIFEQLLLVEAHLFLLFVPFLCLFDAFDVVLADLVGEHMLGLLALFVPVLLLNLALLDTLEQFEFVLEVLFNLHQVFLALFALLLDDDAFVFGGVEHLQLFALNFLNFVDLVHDLLGRLMAAAE